MSSIEQDRVIISSYVLDALSIVICSSISIFSFNKGLHKQFLSELMLWVLIINIIYHGLKFLSINLFLNHKTEVGIIKLNEYDFFQMSLLFFRTYYELILNTLIAFIALKYFDSITKDSYYFKQDKIRVVTRVIIFIIPLILSSIFILIQFFLNDDIIYKGSCNEVQCKFFEPLKTINNAILLLLLIASLVFTIITACFLNSKKGVIQEKDENKRKSFVSLYRRISYKIWIYPIFSFAFLITISLNDILIVFGETADLPGSKFLEIIYSSIQGLFFTGLFIASDQLLWEAIKELFRCDRVCNRDLNTTRISLTYVDQIYEEEDSDFIL